MATGYLQVRRRRSFPTLAILSLCVAGVAHATVYNATPSNYLTLLSSLQPGDTLQLASGTYMQGLSISGMNGTAGAPISIEGPTDQSAQFLGQSCCNTVEIGNSSYIVISNLTLDGQHIDAPFGVTRALRRTTSRSRISSSSITTAAATRGSTASRPRQARRMDWLAWHERKSSERCTHGHYDLLSQLHWRGWSGVAERGDHRERSPFRKHDGKRATSRQVWRRRSRMVRAGCASARDVTSRRQR